MTKEELEASLQSVATRVRRTDDERWMFVAHGVHMQCFCSLAKDRMRIMAAVSYVEDVQPDQWNSLLRASFHSDARYAIHESTVFAVFLHPLLRLSKTEVVNALKQVATLAQTFGKRFAGGRMKFDWPRPRSDDAQIRRRTIEAVQRQLARARGEETS
jgi:hypothetical protein